MTCDDELDDNKELDDESSLIRKLFLKYQKLILKKKFYKQKFSKLNKSFEDFKLEFSNVSSLNKKKLKFHKIPLSKKN